MISLVDSSRIPLLATTDILVVGAGSAGCIAALSAAEAGNYSVMLVERYGFPGGTSTQMLDTFYGFFTPGESPKKVVGGWPDRVVNLLNKTGDIFLRPNTYGAGTGVNYNPERLKLVWDQMITAAGIKYLLHTSLVAVETIPHGYNCIFWNKAGFHRVKATRVIDASGDADFCHLAGFDYELAGDHDPMQSLTTTFRMSNVDLDRYYEAGGKKMLQQKMDHAFESGTYQLPRKEGSAHEMCQEKCISTVAVKVADKHPLKPWELTKAEIEGREQTFIYEKFFREQVPGYEESKVIGMSTQIGIRETRRVYGEKRLTKEDCMSGRVFKDSVFLCGAPIEDHRKGADGEQETIWQYIPNSGVYGVPYGTLVPKGSTNSWVVGRCFSATHDAHASCRSMAQTMSMGQAAGVAAVMSLEGDLAANEIPVNKLRENLHQLGAVLELPDRVADTSRNGWKNNID